MPTKRTTSKNLCFVTVPQENIVVFVAAMRSIYFQKCLEMNFHERMLMQSAAVHRAHQKASSAVRHRNAGRRRGTIVG
ncbi:hypothetical protein ANCDUO_15530 [Ancylostoma duodenale]|uniref:Uncharacterized protein n=1 Tax=Ancylostoma duodenale TaxID=51022 RepID=A0A0C2G0B5_9BILA|nr:hypothetical protein ANCDUO_15530 [Ancylostoma duodenale]